MKTVRERILKLPLWLLLSLVLLETVARGTGLPIGTRDIVAIGADKLFEQPLSFDIMNGEFEPPIDDVQIAASGISMNEAERELVVCLRGASCNISFLEPQTKTSGCWIVIGASQFPWAKVVGESAALTILRDGEEVWKRNIPIATQPCPDIAGALEVELDASDWPHLSVAATEHVRRALQSHGASFGRVFLVSEHGACATLPVLFKSHHDRFWIGVGGRRQWHTSADAVALFVDEDKSARIGDGVRRLRVGDETRKLCQHAVVYVAAPMCGGWRLGRRKKDFWDHDPGDCDVIHRIAAVSSIRTHSPKYYSLPFDDYSMPIKCGTYVVEFRFRDAGNGIEVPFGAYYSVVAPAGPGQRRLCLKFYGPLVHPDDRDGPFRWHGDPGEIRVRAEDDQRRTEMHFPGWDQLLSTSTDDWYQFTLIVEVSLQRKDVRRLEFFVYLDDLLLASAERRTAEHLGEFTPEVRDWSNDYLSIAELRAVFIPISQGVAGVEG